MCSVCRPPSERLIVPAEDREKHEQQYLWQLHEQVLRAPGFPNSTVYHILVQVEPVEKT